MPIYLYECRDCYEEWKVRHGMSEEEKRCTVCESVNIARKPSEFALGFKKPSVKQKIGDLTKDFIKDSKEDLKQQKKELDETR